MAKKKDSSKQQRTRTDAVRAAVDQAFQATADAAEQTQKAAQTRVQEVTDEFATLVTKLRDVIDDARPAASSDIDGLREDVAALTARVAKLEAAAKRPARAKSTTPRTPPA